ncbi:hypothetical protein F5Y17DRAFT_289590 [Xylariaceae sp. FL0594]|nr:hypothetical protein F5Y17DRAFT_289590 [Xylariaceae sp. FL0594]
MDGNPRPRANYRPPFRQDRSDGHGNHNAGDDARVAEQSGYRPRHENSFNGQNQRNSFFRGRGYRGNHRGNSRGGRGGRGGFQNGSFENRDQDESTLYQLREIEAHFWPGKPKDGNSQSTLHGSKERPDDLTYVLLFNGANPRWPRDRIIFTKSNLALLPEFLEKKAEHGEWETQKRPEENDSDANTQESTEASDSKDGSVATDEAVAGATIQGNKDDSSVVQQLEINKIGAAKDTSEEIAEVTEKSMLDHEQEVVDNTFVGEKDLDNADTTTAPPSAPVLEPVHASVVPSSRSKYTDIRLENPDNDFAFPAPASSAHKEHTNIHNQNVDSSPAPAAAPLSNRSKYTNIRLENANNEFPSKPTITSDNGEKDTTGGKEDIAAPLTSTSTSIPSNRMKFNDVRLEDPNCVFAPSTAASSSPIKYNDGRLEDPNCDFAATALSSHMKFNDVRLEDPNCDFASSATTASNSRMKFNDVLLEDPNCNFASSSNSRMKFNDVRLEDLNCDFATTASNNRMKYSDIRKEEAQDPVLHAMSDNRSKYTDIRLMSPEELHQKDEPNQASAVLNQQHNHHQQGRDYPTIKPIDYSPADPQRHQPIAIFEERHISGGSQQRPRNKVRRFAFKGWFKVSRVNILAPQSAELVRMLLQKWERKDFRSGAVVPGSKQRDPAAWNASLAVEWAVVKFERLVAQDGEDAVPPPPKIEKMSDDSEPLSVAQAGVQRSSGLAALRKSAGRFEARGMSAEEADRILGAQGPPMIFKDNRLMPLNHKDEDRKDDIHEDEVHEEETDSLGLLLTKRL